MKKYILCVLVCGVILSLASGCGRNKITEDEEAGVKNQLVEILAADHDIIGMISDNDEIYELIKNKEIEKWEYIDQVPENAEKKLLLYSYEEVTEAAFLKNGQPWITASKTTLYYDGRYYYVLEQLLDEAADFSAARITKKAGEYLMGLADRQLEETSKEAAMSHWKAHYNPEDFAEKEETAMAAAEVSKEQRLEMIDLDTGKTLRATSDLEEITEFLNRIEMPEWEQIEAIPHEADNLYVFVRYAQGGEIKDKELVKMYHLILYQDEDGYYMEEVISGDLEDEENQLKGNNKFKITAAAGEYLCNFK